MPKQPPPGHRRRLRVLTAVVVAVLAVPLALPGGPPAAGAALPPNLDEAPLGLIAGVPGRLECPEARRCSGFLAGADGTALDVDLVLPATQRYPLVVHVHGWGGSKGTGDALGMYPGDRFLTDRGYAVLRYSARGLGKSWGQTSLGAPEAEIADLRSLVSAVVDDGRFRVDAARIAVMGSSYGGHHAWAAAATRPVWSTPGGTTVRIAAVIPIMTWTDLRASLLPNGNRADPGVPVGTPKLSYLIALNGIGGRADPERPYPNYQPPLAVMLARAIAGEPFQVGSVLEPTAAAMVEYLKARSVASRPEWFARLRSDRSAWVPVLAIQGWTDDLFPSAEATRVVRRLKEVSPDYPVKLYLGDTGHPRAGNPAQERQLIHGLISDWLRWWLEDEGPAPTFDVTSSTTGPGGFDPSLLTTTRTLDELSTGSVGATFGGPLVLVNQPVQLGGLDADPTLRELFVNPLTGRLPFPGDAGGIAMDKPVEELGGGAPVWYTGSARVTLTGTLVGTDVQYDVRLWDQDEQGAARLVDRGTTKYAGTPGPVTVHVELFGNAWRFQPGHTLRLEVTNADVPFLRPNTLPSTTILDGVVLDLPVRALDAPRTWVDPGTGRTAGSPKPAPEAPAPEAPAPVEVLGVQEEATRGRLSVQDTGVDRAGAASEPQPAGDPRPLTAALIAAPFLLAIGVAALRARRS